MSSRGRKRYAKTAGRGVVACGMLIAGILSAGTVARAGMAARARQPAQGASRPAPVLSAADSALLQRMIDAEDARASDSATLAPIYAGLRDANPEVRRIAVRALGRLERAAALGPLRKAFDDTSAAVRAEAINALGQILQGEMQRAGSVAERRDSVARAVAAASALIHALAASEADPRVREITARTLGRLPYASVAEAQTAANAIGELTTAAAGHVQPPPDSAPPFGVVHGMDALLRRFAAVRRAPAFVRAAAGSRAGNAVKGVGATDGTARERDVIRTSVAGRLLSTTPPSAPALDTSDVQSVRAGFLADFAASDPQRRRQAVSMVTTAALDDSTRARLIDAALRDASATVRLEGVRAFARRRGVPCAPLRAATRDANAHVALAAIDALGAPCEGSDIALERLAGLVRSIPRGAVARRGTRGSWHEGAHAIVALARVAPERARAALPGLAAHPVWQVRMYAARAAGPLADTATLIRLTRDDADNVRDAAVTSLAELVRPPAAGSGRLAIPRSERLDSIFVAQLARRDYQLVLDAAKALDGAPPSARLVDALLNALDRITAERSETSRDPRMELLARIQTFGTADQTSRVAPYLHDFDEAVAERAAAVLRGWGQAEAVAAPRPLVPVPVSLDAVNRVRDARIRVTMAQESGGGSFEMRLFVDEAPATVARVVSLVRRGYYNGLTFHRVAPNFVIQGGGPGANEYSGAARFMRDELGLRSHARGTVGISTRGRDSGDAQIFINLIDNWRLDHEFTVFAEVVRGMDVVDGILEGDVMSRVEILDAR